MSMTSTENLHSAIGELAYAIARADGAIQMEEQTKFKEIVREAIKAGQGNFDITDIMFQVLERDKYTDTETAYDWAMKTIRLNSHYLSPELKDTYIKVIEAVAKAYPPVTRSEADLIARFKKDIAPLTGDPVYYR
jgi:uncharacterized tellurite resistance protein B-like protein